MKLKSLQDLSNKRQALFRKRGEEGLTLIEASMVLALSAVVVAGVMLYYQSASDNNRLQSALGELGGIQTAIQTLYSGQSDYSGFGISVLTGNSSIPPNYQTLTAGKLTALTNPWGGGVSIAVDTTTPSQYTVAFDSVPQSACTPFASQNLGSQMLGLKINTHIETGVPSPASAAADCDQTGSGANANKITWTLH